MVRKVNWLGLAAGMLTLVVLLVSLYVPWWQLTIGQGLIRVNASPVYTKFGLLGTPFTIPIIWALNLITILTFAVSGIVMLIYSLVPTKPYAKHLLGFSWKKPLYSIIGFAVPLLIILLIAGHFGINLPLNSSSNVMLPRTMMPEGVTISALVSGAFQLPFYLAIVAAALCVGARFYHPLVAKPSIVPAQTVTPATPAASNA